MIAYNLCDAVQATPFDVVREVVGEWFGQNFDELFELLDVEPVGSASVA